MSAAIDEVVLPWHAETWSRVQDALDTGRLGHALLLAGPSGVGKRAFARRLAASLLCESRGQDGAACGDCRGCVQFAAGTHPNLTWLTREVNEKTDKEKRDISMDQLRTMMEKLVLNSHYGRARVVVIDPADALNTSGVNAVLKTVEEPPPGIHILLVSERPMSLLPTLRSRCQRLNFAPPEAGIAEGWLRNKFPKIDAAAALQAVGGAPLAAVIAQESGSVQQRNTWRDQLLAVADQKIDPLTAAGKVASSGVKLTPDVVQDWLRNYTRLLHRILLAMSGIEVDEPVARLARRLGATHVEQLLAETVDGHRRLMGNANLQLLIESLMISWWRRSAPPDTRRTHSA